MGYVVKVTGSGFGVTWLARGEAGSYKFGPRKDATVFLTPAQAQDAAAKASKAFGALGMIFTVEPAD
jgi:hypothetical protein